MAEGKATTRKRDTTFNPSVSSLTKLQKMWGEARFCIIDECSMFSCQWNGLLAARIEAARASIVEAPFGGVHMIYCGSFSVFDIIDLSHPPASTTMTPLLLSRDFAQLPPISTIGLPLYTRMEWLDMKKPRAVLGKQMWDSLTHAVILDEGMRAAGDPVFRDFLERLRHGESRLIASRGGTHKGPEPDDFDYIHSRMIDKLSVSAAQQAELLRNGGIVTRNAVRLVTNNDAALREAKRLGVQPLVSVAEDRTGAPHDRLTFTVRRRLLRQHESNDTGYLSGCLVLVPGMKYSLKVHIARDIPGLSRNSPCTLLKVILDPREPEPTTLDPNKPRFLKYMPLHVLMHFPDAPNQRFHVGLPPRTLSITPTSVSTGTKTAQGNTVRRKQFGFVLGAFGTDYNNQGRTFLGAGFVDLARPADPRGYNAATPYVCLSRFTKLDDIFLLRPIPLEAFKRVISRDQRQDADRLQRLSTSTILANCDRFAEHFPDFDPKTRIVRSSGKQRAKPPTLEELYKEFRSTSEYVPAFDDSSEQEETDADASDADAGFSDTNTPPLNLHNAVLSASAR